MYSEINERLEQDQQGIARLHKIDAIHMKTQEIAILKRLEADIRNLL